MKIVFIGASGMLGRPVAGALIHAGHEVTLLVRNVGKMGRLFPGVPVGKGNVFDKDTLAEAFDGADAVYLNLSVDPTTGENALQPEREGIRNIIEAAKEKKIKRLVYLSSLIKNYQGMNGFQWWAFDIKQKAVDAIRLSGINYTIFYPSTFMETLPYQMVRANRLMLIGNSFAPMWFIAAEDYARQVARSFEVAAPENKEWIVQGPEPFTFDEAAHVFVRNYVGGKIKQTRLPIGFVRFLGKFSRQMNYGYHICEALNKYPEKFESEDTWKELGAPTVSLQQFAASLAKPAI